MQSSNHPSSGPLAEFIDQHRQKVTGVLEGFDPVRVQASLRSLYHPQGMEYYLLSQKILFKDFKGYLTRLTNRVRAAGARLAQRSGRRVIYLQSNCYHKEDLAREEMKRQELKLNWGKCIHLYFYWLHKRLGFLHLRLQTGFPFLLQICFNGREWLARQMDQAGLDYRRRDNCFAWLQDPVRAQRWMNQQLQVRWQPWFEPWVNRCHRLPQEICRPMGTSYYWTVAESEYATDVMFKTQADLQAVYPAMVHHSVMSFGSQQVLRFLPRKAASEVKTDRRLGPEGIRVKHWLNDNSLKLYDKGSVLRSEVTINNPKDFRVFRASELKPDGDKTWRLLRRTVADGPRRAQVCRGATHRHLQALSVVKLKTPWAQAADRVCRPIRKQGRCHRGLRPLGSDAS